MWKRVQSVLIKVERTQFFALKSNWVQKVDFCETRDELFFVLLVKGKITSPATKLTRDELILQQNWGWNWFFFQAVQDKEDKGVLQLQSRLKYLTSSPWKLINWWEILRNAFYVATRKIVGYIGKLLNKTWTEFRLDIDAHS